MEGCEEEEGLGLLICDCPCPRGDGAGDPLPGQESPECMCHGEVAIVLPPLREWTGIEIRAPFLPTSPGSQVSVSKVPSWEDFQASPERAHWVSGCLCSGSRPLALAPSPLPETSGVMILLNYGEA